MKKTIISLLLITVALTATASPSGRGTGGGQDSLQAAIDSATVAYNNKRYNDALATLKGVEAAAGTSSELCYDIAGNYYRLGNNVQAIIYYERALLIDPSNDDARRALDITRHRAVIDDDAFASDHYVTATLKRWLLSHRWESYATLGVVAFLLALIGGGVFVAAGSPLWRKVGFFGGIVMLTGCVALNAMAFAARDYTAGHRFAIATAAPVTRLNAVPRATADSAQVALTVKAGTRLLIVDSVNANVDGTAPHWWYAVEHPRSEARRAWVDSRDVVRP